MTWARLIQSGFESGTINEGNFAGGEANATVSVDSGVSGFFNALGQGSDFVFGHFGSGHQQMRCGFLCRPNGNFQQAVTLFEWFTRETDGNAIFIVVASDEHTWQLIYRDPTNGAQTTLETATIFADGYNHADALVAFGATISIGADTHLSFYLNGQRILNYTGALLDNAISVMGFAVHRGLIFAGNSTFTDFDDIYCDTEDGSVADAIPPTLRFPFARPTGDGSASDWTPASGTDHFAAVDEYPPTDANFLHTTTVDQTELFSVPAFTLADYHEIVAVVPLARAKKGDAQVDSEFSLVLYNSGAVQESVSAAQDLGVGFEYYFGRFTTEPSGLDWAEAFIPLIEYGFRARGTL